jgi:hypothetical protein
MPKNIEIPVATPEVTVHVNAVIKQNNIKKVAEKALKASKDALVEHFRKAFRHDIGLLKSVVPTNYRCSASKPAGVMPDGTPIEEPTGEIAQVQVKVNRKEVSAEDSDMVFRTIGAENHEKILEEVLALDSVPLVNALEFAKNNPEHCTISAAGTDQEGTVTIQISQAHKIPGAQTKAVVQPVEGFLDALRELDPKARKAILPVVNKILDNGLNFAVALGNTTAEKANKKTR